MEVLYLDDSLVVCLKPAGVLSTDEPGGMPELVRQVLHDPEADVRTVHRLDRVVSGVMVLARSAECASDLCRQISERSFGKEYLAVVHRRPHRPSGTFTDLLRRDPAERKTYPAKKMARGVQKAVLEYETCGFQKGMSLVKVHLVTGRTHQIRAQFSFRGMPLVGDRKYSELPDDCPIALWSHSLSFRHPVTGETLTFTHEPPDIYPWTVFLPETKGRT